MLNQEINFLLLKCFHYSNKMIVQKTSELGLYPGQPKILECLLEKDGQTPKEIGKTCVLDKSTMTILLQKMEKQGLIYRKSHHHDKRSIQIFLTDSGHKLALKVKQICYEADSIAYQSLKKEEVNDLLNQIIQNFQEAYHE